MKSLKLFTVLSSVVVIGGVSTLAVLSTSCGGGGGIKVEDFGTWDMNGQVPETWPVNIADAIAGYDLVFVIYYPWTDYSSEATIYYMQAIVKEDSDYDLPYMYTTPDQAGFNFYSGQPGTYENLKVLVNKESDYVNHGFTYLGKLTAIITSAN